mgnify:CR=1 FL=1
MLHPARLGIDLFVLFLAYRNNLIPKLLNTLCPVQPGGRKRASGHLLRSVPTKVIRNQPKLFEGCLEVVDDFLGDDVTHELWEVVSDTFISPTSIFIGPES